MNAEPSHMFSNVNSQIISWENRALLFQCVFTAFCSLRLCVWGSARLSFSEFWHLVIGDKFLSPAFLFYAVEPGLRLQRKTLRWVNVKIKKCEWRLKTLHLAFRRATDADSVLCFLTSGFKKTLSSVDQNHKTICIHKFVLSLTFGFHQSEISVLHFFS